ncbi:MAG: hypothetical protein SOU16_07060 [Faecalimonas sp.]|nr:hypothetical protein [Faecalimonas sp.]
MLKNKRKRVAALLVGCMVLGSSMSVFAGSDCGVLKSGIAYDLKVAIREATANTWSDSAVTKVTGYRYPSSGNPSQVINMGTKSGGASVSITPPAGWVMYKAESYHSSGGYYANLIVFE